MIKNKKILLIILLAVAIPSYAGMGHFYQAHFLPDIYNTDTCDWHTKLRAYFLHGSTTQGRDAQGDCTSILDIRGPQNWLEALQGVPAEASIESLRNTADSLVAAVQAGGAAPNFGKLSFDGTFTSNTLMLFLRQNLTFGLFATLLLPVRDLTIDAISFTDLSPDTGTFSKENSDWIILKDNIDRILNAYGINSYQNPFKKTVPGDLVGMIGWQRVFKEIPGAVIDLFSINLKVGFSFPTGSTLDPSEPFALQGGHLKHVGLVGTANLLIGFASYLELGLEVNGMKFIDKTVTRRMKTAVDQSGFIELASGKAYEKLGDRYGITPYTVFHPPFMSNLSMLVAYSYQRHTKKELCPKNTIVFDSAIVNAMNTEFTWSLIHLKLNYMLNYFPCIKPNIGLLVDIPVGGKHIFNTTMAGGAIGLNLNWSF